MMEVTYKQRICAAFQKLNYMACTVGDPSAITAINELKDLLLSQALILDKASLKTALKVTRMPSVQPQYYIAKTGLEQSLIYEATDTIEDEFLKEDFLRSFEAIFGKFNSEE